MEAKEQKCNNVTIANATYLAQQRIESTIRCAEDFKTDPNKTDRHIKQECPVCYYYAGRVGGAALTTAKCALCKVEMHFCSTCVDLLCRNCARNYNLCMHCGGDIDAFSKRKQRFINDSERSAAPMD